MKVLPRRAKSTGLSEYFPKVGQREPLQTPVETISLLYDVSSQHSILMWEDSSDFSRTEISDKTEVKNIIEILGPD